MCRPRLFSSRLLLALLFATLVASGCAGNSASGGTAPGNFATWEWRVTVRNQTDRYVLLSRYWTNVIVKPWWELDNNFNCIAPHDEVTTAIEYNAFSGAGAELHADIQPGTGCQVRSTGGIWGNRCQDRLFESKTSHQVWSVVRAEAFVKYDGTDYSLPTSCDVAHW